MLFEFLANVYGIELESFPKLEQYMPTADAGDVPPHGEQGNTGQEQVK